ncbi:photosystem i p700 chlorophyll a apoprotein a1 [Phtheirospermum japonicum]|uniref:Photosystem i p700 chlorophyll a apoprotein a1 n=1 Tax=Phtheirospermum japonicum TaxID=374723 RepID=A0A830B7M3_9LAMI|nr:photosystem i p700 chlorophyll a apoprotein a1 [Phtheirospermum japonicum]
MSMLMISIAIPVIWRRSLEKYLVSILVNSPSSFFERATCISTLLIFLIMRRG